MDGSGGDTQVPLADVLGRTFEVPPLPEGWTPLEGILLVKCLDDEGHSSWAFRTTRGINDEELLGALMVRTELCRRSTLAMYEGPDED